MRSFSVAVLFVIAPAVAACGTDEAGPADHPGAGGAGATGGADAGGAGGVGGTAPPTPDGVWTWVGVSGSACRDGTPTGFAVNASSSSNDLLIYLKGGAACHDAATCGIGNPKFGEADLPGYLPSIYPALDRSRADNPLGAYNYVLVPECTGDVYSGNNPNGKVSQVDGTQHFVGFFNYGLYLERLAPMFPSVKRIVMMGCSAGGYGVRTNLERTLAAFPGVPITVISDSAPPVGAPYNPSSLQALQRQLWNIQESILDPCGASCPNQDDYAMDSVSALAKRHPEVRFGVISYTTDSSLPSFWGITPSEFTEALWDSRGKMLAAHPNIAYYVIDGVGHCVLGDAFSTTAVEGVKLTDWVASIIDGKIQQAGQPVVPDGGADAGADAGP